MRHLNDVRRGLYKLQLVRGGPWVAAQIHHSVAVDPVTGETLDRSWYWWAEIDGKVAGDVSPTVSDDVWNIHLHGTPITQDEYAELTETAARVRASAPHMPEADPRKRIKLRELPPLYGAE